MIVFNAATPIIPFFILDLDVHDPRRLSAQVARPRPGKARNFVGLGLTHVCTELAPTSGQKIDNNQAPGRAIPAAFERDNHPFSFKRSYYSPNSQKGTEACVDIDL